MWTLETHSDVTEGACAWNAKRGSALLVSSPCLTRINSFSQMYFFHLYSLTVFINCNCQWYLLIVFASVCISQAYFSSFCTFQIQFSIVFLSCILQCISYVYFPTVFLCSGVATLLNPHQSSLQLHKCSLSSPPVSITFATASLMYFFSMIFGLE